MSKVFAILAEFNDPSSLMKAAEYFSENNYKKFDTYSPFPIHGMDHAMGLKDSVLGWITLVGGIVGLFGGFGMQLFMSLDYKIIISGKPFASYPAFIPVTFEIMVLLSAFATVFGMFALNRLPEHSHPLFNSEVFRKVTDNGFFLAVESSDELYDDVELKKIFNKLKATHIEEVYE